ncbi:hypothetical protein SAMN06265374_0147 [Roseibium denhamense]|uniref:Uncharacterized protein n=1 Tax=Roseibium denhamense TaxID=76305 RepID=A0ABY1PMJ8_9HYPH|nr:hypothetical protein SAMN06265374_0147 [Roseibium denhamense]
MRHPQSVIAVSLGLRFSRGPVVVVHARWIQLRGTGQLWAESGRWASGSFRLVKSILPISDDNGVNIGDRVIKAAVCFEESAR